jgi:hypothetical protein
MMPPLPLLSVLLLAGPSCDNGTFPTKLHRRQYMGLSGAGVTATDDECREKCCAAGKAKCDVWLRRAQGCGGGRRRAALGMVSSGLVLHRHCQRHQRVEPGLVR